MQTTVPQVGLSQPEDTSRELSDPPDLARLNAARWAFRRYHAHCFWYLRSDLKVTLEDLPTIADGLRKNGGRNGFLLAAKLFR